MFLRIVCLFIITGKVSFVLNRGKQGEIMTKNKTGKLGKINVPKETDGSRPLESCYCFQYIT